MQTEHPNAAASHEKPAASEKQVCFFIKKPQEVYDICQFFFLGTSYVYQTYSYTKQDNDGLGF